MTNKEVKALVSVTLQGILDVTNNGINDPEKELHVLIFTNFGHIKADSIEFLTDNDLVDLDPVETYLKASVVKVGDQGSKDSTLLIRNAAITPFGYKEPQHIVTHKLLFTDQIVGLSFK